MATPSTPKIDSCTACGATKSVCCFDKTGSFTSAKCSDAGAFCDPATKLCTTSDGKWGSLCANDGDPCDQNLGLQCQTDPNDSKLKCLCKTDYAACAVDGSGNVTSVCVPGTTPTPPSGGIPDCSDPSFLKNLRTDRDDINTCAGPWQPTAPYVSGPGKSNTRKSWNCGLTVDAVKNYNDGVTMFACKWNKT